MTLIIAGSRTMVDPEVLKAALAAFSIWPDEVREVVSGREPNGVDRLGETWAMDHQIPIACFEADWDRHGKRAGPLRNRDMAEYAHLALDGRLLLIWDGTSPGSRSMWDEARVYGVPTYIWYTQEVTLE